MKEKKAKKEKEVKKEVHPPIEGVQTYMPGTDILTREYRVKSKEK